MVNFEYYAPTRVVFGQQYGEAGQDMYSKKILTDSCNLLPMF